jgi:uncharacterized protein DUF6948
MIARGTKVIVRTYSAGVHFGTLEDREGQEIHLKNARRLWSWNGALSLSEVASKGIDLASSRISVPVEEIILTQAIEIIPIDVKSNLPCN